MKQIKIWFLFIFMVVLAVFAGAQLKRGVPQIISFVQTGPFAMAESGFPIEPAVRIWLAGLAINVNFALLAGMADKGGCGDYLFNLIQGIIYGAATSAASGAAFLVSLSVLSNSQAVFLVLIPNVCLHYLAIVGVESVSERLFASQGEKQGKRSSALPYRFHSRGE